MTENNPEKIILCVCGGRDYDNKSELDTILTVWASEFSNAEITLITGGAKGADTLAVEWAQENGHKILTFSPQYKLYPNNAKYAPLARNLDMINFGFDYLIAFPGGNGTRHMLENSIKDQKTNPDTKIKQIYNFMDKKEK